MDMLDMGLPQLPGGQKKSFEFRDILSAGWRRKWLLIIPFIACFIGGLLICAFWTKQYESLAVMEFHRRPIIGAAGSAETFRYHQTKFRERATALQLKVINPKTLEPRLRQVPNLIDPNKGPSFGYQLKVLFFGLEKEETPGVAEQIDGIISRIRIEIDERRPLVKVSFAGTSRAQAVQVCQLLVDMFREEDATRRNALDQEKKDRNTRKDALDWDLREVEQKLGTYRAGSNVRLLPEYMPYLRERLRNYRFDLRQLTSKETDLRTAIGLALAKWRTTERELPIVAEDGEKQENLDEQMLAADRLVEVEEAIKNLEMSYPPGHPYLEDGYRLRKELLIKKQIEKKKISELSYKLPQLEKKHEELAARLQELSDDITETFEARQELIDGGADAESEEVKNLGQELLDKQKEHSGLNKEAKEVAKELREYIRLQRLDEAGRAVITGKREAQPAEGEEGGEAGDQAGGAATDKVDIKSLREELNRALGDPRVNSLWITGLAQVVSLSHGIENVARGIDYLKKDMKKVEDDITQAQIDEQEIRKLKEKRLDLTNKFESAEKKYQVAEDVLRAFDTEYGERMVLLVPPQFPRAPRSPNTRAVLIVAALAGLVVGSVLVVIGEVTDHTLKKPKDLKNIVRQPVLAAIPSLELPPGDRGTPQSLFYRTKYEVEQDIERGALFEKEYLRDIRFRTIATEQMRKLRIAMLEGGLAGDNRPRTILLTSALAGEGKSTVSANLAVAISQMIGEHVLLVDGDLRRPDLHNFFGLQPKPGLAEYLTEDLDLADLLVKTGFEKLTLLQAGRVPANSTELLHSEKMRNLIKELKSRYSDRYIIIDSPPLLSTSEPDVLAEQVDGIMLVVRAGMTPREIVEDVLSQLNSDKILGVVMNDVRSGISKYYVPSYSA